MEKLNGFHTGENIYRGIIEHGKLVFQPIKMKTYVFVRHIKDDGSLTDEVFIFNNPKNERIDPGTVVLCDTKYGVKDAVVISSVKIFKKYANALVRGFLGNKYGISVKNIIGEVECEKWKNF